MTEQKNWVEKIENMPSHFIAKDGSDEFLSECERCVHRDSDACSGCKFNLVEILF